MTGTLVVVGDVLLDRDVYGRVDRLCPDAPAPVLDESSALDRPGGAGLAAVLAAGQGLAVTLVTAMAYDSAAARLTELLSAAGVRLYALPLNGASTVEKIRLRSDGRTLLRLDRGGSVPSPGEPSEAVHDAFANASAILVSDYGYGLARHPALRQALATASAPIVWDPHPRGPAAVAGVCLATPNESELWRLTGDAGDGERLAAVTRGAQRLRERWRCNAVAVTMGAQGALLCHAGATPLVVTAPAGPDAPRGSRLDTCGAGDRFAAAAAGALADGALVSEAVQHAVAEASAYVAAGGSATVSCSPSQVRPQSTPTSEGSARSGTDAGAIIGEVRARGGTVVATGGCFDLLHAGHLATLQAARQLGDCLIVCLNSDTSVAGLKPGRPLTRQADRARLLAALECVDAVVIFDEPTPNRVLSWLRPDIWVKGGDYSGDSEADLPEADLVRRWGGQTVVVPYLDGRSTTATITAARSGRRLSRDPSEGAR
jgi:rfaE bifunctional protein nucleotidyltransferase chain/domain/rfaE bifunctional protein kinase chain/domain